VPHLLATVLGLAAVLHASAVAFEVVKYLGVAYLAYLAVMTWRAGSQLELDADERSKSGLRSALRGFLINILNPKLSVFFLAFLPQFVAANSASPLVDLSALSGVFMGMTLVVFAAYGLLADWFRAGVASSPVAQKWLQRTFSIAFAALAARLALAER
jgi:threonine/homoserine/homoserine lactone efflux protein